MNHSSHLENSHALFIIFRTGLSKKILFKQSGMSLIPALLFLGLISLLVVEATEINRMYFLASENYRVSMQAEAYADETCQSAHRVLENIFSEEPLESLSFSDVTSLKLTKEDFYSLSEENYNSDSIADWPFLMTTQRGDWNGYVRFSFKSVQYTSIDNPHQHYANDNSFDSGVEMVEMLFELSCEARLEESVHSSARIHRDYRMVKLRTT